MGLINSPEVKLAQRIHKKHNLKIPFDLTALVKSYANLIYTPIPIQGIDGVCLNLKVPGKKPTVIVNSELSENRKHFTLAHELGHIIIPWHLGTIVDENYSQFFKNLAYRELEQEANNFAAELLMPMKWVKGIWVKYKDDIAIAHEKISEIAGVSNHAAAIQLTHVLPPNVLYIAEEQGEVSHAGKSNDTHAFLPSPGSSFSMESYPYLDAHSEYHSGFKTYHWLTLSQKINIDDHDEGRTWREILDNILADINPSVGRETLKKRINGVIAFINGRTKQSLDYSEDSLGAACIYRLKRDDLEEFTSHPDFEIFVKIRVKDFFLKKPSKAKRKAANEF